MARSTTTCPRCGGPVARLTIVVADHGQVQPCGHHVLVVQQPDRVVLEAV